MALNPITGIHSPPVRGGYVERPSPASAGPSSDKPVGEVDQVRLTPGSMSLRQLETARQEPPVDEAKVAALRAAIADGSYRPDASRIARKLSDFEQSLFP